MISRATASFWRCLERLDPVQREAARKAFRTFMDDPGHNSLRFKKLAGHSEIWSARVTLDVRAVAHRSGDTVTWFWIGQHKEFDQLFG